MKLFKAWDNLDPAKKGEAALTPRHLRFIYDHAQSSHNVVLRAQADLLIGAYFFAMRSCEYTHTTNRGKTALLTVQDVVFVDPNNITLSPHDPILAQRAKFVRITFQQQKNNHKNETRVHQRSGDNVLCPVRAWASTIARIVTSPGTGPHTTVNFVYNPQQPLPHRSCYLTQKATNTILRSTCNLIKPPLGYAASDIGSHSIRSGAAMALFLSKNSVASIMKTGRWSSNAFLDYIRPQVNEWSDDLAASMVRIHDFHHNPHPQPCNPSTVLDPRADDHPLRRLDPLSSTSVGGGTHSFIGSDSAFQMAPRLHLYH